MEADEAAKALRERYLTKYQTTTGCSRATAFRHWKIFREGGSPFDKDYKNNTDFISSKGYEMQIRKIFFANPGIGAKKIYKEIGKPLSPTLTTVKRFVRKLNQELDAE
jgi:hypothetical protein